MGYGRLKVSIYLRTRLISLVILQKKNKQPNTWLPVKTGELD